MNKVIKIIIHTLFFINILFLVIFYNIAFTNLTMCAIIMLILLVIDLFQIKRKDKILDNNNYNFMLLFINSIVLIIFLRDKLDIMIPLGTANNVEFYSAPINSLFIDYNALYISILYVALILYNLLNMNYKKLKKKVIK